MKKIRIKNAFSLAELLILMVIVGVISVMMLTIIKPNQKALKYQYYNAYNTLLTAAYNINQDAIDTKENNIPGTPAEDKRFPTVARELCKKLAGYGGSSAYGYINTTVNNCTSTPTVGRNGNPNNFNDGVMAFQASNSMKYYITDRSTATISNSLGPTLSLPYFIVWVDLNGDRRPNTTISKEGRPADIVPFLVADYGYVVPLGAPITDRLFMQARVKIVTDEKTYYSRPMTFYEAQTAAYGNKQYPDTDLFSVKNTWKSVFAGTKAVPTSYPSGSQLNECRPPDSSSIPPCTVEIDEQKAL